MPFYRAVWAIYREWYGTVTDASCYSSEWNSTALAHCTTKLRGTAMSWQTKQVWAPKTSLTNFPFIKTTIHVHNFPQFPVTPQEQRLFFTKRIHISVNVDAHFCDMKQGTTASLVNLSSSTTFKNHQEVSVSVLNLQSGKQAELNEQVPIHSKVGSWVSHGKDGPETYDLPERQCQDTTTAQHGSREGGDVITWGGQCYLHHFQFLNPSCLSDYFFKQKQSGNFSFWIYLTWILMLCI